MIKCIHPTSYQTPEVRKGKIPEAKDRQDQLRKAG